MSPAPRTDGRVWLGGRRLSAQGTLGVACGVALVLLAGWVLLRARRVLGWALVAAILAALLWPVRAWLDRHLPKALATLISVLLLIVAPFALVLASAHDVDQQFDRLRDSLLEASANVEASSEFGDVARRVQLSEQVEDLLDAVEPTTTGGVTGTASLLAAFVAVVVLSIFFVVDGRRFARALLRQFGDEQRQERWGAVLANGYGLWWRYLLRVLAKATVVGLITFAVCQWFDLPAATLLALVAGVVSIVPTLGLLIGGIPVVILIAGLHTVWPAGILAGLALVGLQVADHVAMRLLIEPASLTIGPVVPLITALVVLQVGGFGAAACGVVVVMFAMALTEAAAAGLSPVPPPS